MRSLAVNFSQANGLEASTGTRVPGFILCKWPLQIARRSHAWEYEVIC